MKRFLLTALVAAGAAGLLLAGCQPTLWVGMRFLYDEVELPEEQILKDLPYRTGPDADSQRHRLDLFLPDAATLADSAKADSVGGWPTVVFVHGGGWTEGDKDLRIGYEDVYGNIGRFLAARGIGAAVVNYRLLDLGSSSDSSSSAWPDQIADVAAATAFVHQRIAEYGGDPDQLFLMGHSAGAQLAARVALDPQPLARRGLSTELVAGLISVSGAGLDLTDERTYELSDTPGYYGRRFDTRPDWQEAASPASFIDAGDPPVLVLFAEGESASLKRQSRVFDETLTRAGVPSRVVTVPGQSHERMVLTLSRDDRTAGPAMLAFIRRHAATARPQAR
jgi:acetyl esterase/lipase